MAEGGLHPRPHRRPALRDRRGPALDKKFKHDIEVVVDRLVVREDIATRLADSFETALKLADGLAYVDPADPVEPATPKSAVLGNNAPDGRIVFSEKFACPISGFTISEIEPRLFSFNAPQGRVRPVMVWARS